MPYQLRDKNGSLGYELWSGNKPVACEDAVRILEDILGHDWADPIRQRRLLRLPLSTLTILGIDNYRLVPKSSWEVFSLGYELRIESGFTIDPEESVEILSNHFGACWETYLDDEGASGLDGFVTSFVYDLTEYRVYRVLPKAEICTSLDLPKQASV